MSELTTKLAERKKREDDANVYEGFGKLNNVGEGTKHGYTPPAAVKDLKPKGLGQWFRKRAPTIVSKAASTSECSVLASAPEPPPEIPHRTVWVTSTLEYSVSAKDEDVLRDAAKLKRTLCINERTATRLALLTKIKADADMCKIYVNAISLFLNGVEVIKVCRSAKLRKRSLSVSDNTMCVTGRRLDCIPMEKVKDVFPGNNYSDEFKKVKEKLARKNDRSLVDAKIPNGRSATILTTDRTYSFVFNKQRFVDYLCALIDIHKGIHGPTVWKTAYRNDSNVFSHDTVLGGFY